MKHQRTKVFQLRLTTDELLSLKEKSVPYQSVSHFIRQAVEEFSRVDVRQQIGMMQDLCAFYQKFQNELSWTGSNLNQSVKRAWRLPDCWLPVMCMRCCFLPSRICRTP